MCGHKKARPGHRGGGKGVPKGSLWDRKHVWEDEAWMCVYTGKVARYVRWRWAAIARRYGFQECEDCGRPLPKSDTMEARREVQKAMAKESQAGGLLVSGEHESEE